MRIAIDISHLNHEKLSGIGVYTIELMRELQKISDIKLIPVYRPSRFRHRHFFSQHLMPLQMSARPWLLGGLGIGADVIHGPDFKVSGSWRAKRVASIMDLAFLTAGMTSPDFAKKKQKDLDQLLDLKTPDALISISAATTHDLLKYRPQLKSRVHTVLLGGDHFQFSNSVNVNRTSPYFLFVGNLEARKNVLGIVNAFELFCKKHSGYELILIGKPGYESAAIMAAIENSPAKRSIKVLGYASSEELQGYYQGAEALLYPSWIEGFGIPVIEAMHLGCLVITSSLTSTAEIIGSTGWGIDPANSESIMQAMLEVAHLRQNPDLREQKVRAAKTQAQKFTWKKCAEETAAVYRQLL